MVYAGIHHAFTVGVTPSSAAGTILVSVYSKCINRSDCSQFIIPAMQTESCDIQGDVFIGIVAAVGGDTEGEGFNLGDAVAGYVNAGSWVDTVDGSNQVYLNAQPSYVRNTFPVLGCNPPDALSQLWKLSSAAAQELGVVAPVTNDGCVIV
ncbi:hypothetical protein FRB98_003270 [Tulasnella sp. 332]|nr:hypothetical protein FRB98_003270 [Tulasnella sp. 332]